MKSVNLATVAQHEYYARAKDESFVDVAAVLANASADKLRCGSKDLALQSLRAVATPTGVRLQGPRLDVPPAAFNNWSWSQLNREIGAPSAYTAGLPAELAADCLNHGIANVDTAPRRLFFRRGDDGTLTLRSLTSTSYGRLYDADIIAAVARVAERTGLTSPPVWEGGTGGAYRGERDTFIILTSGGSIVTDPSARNGNGAMYRGLIIKNSEIGAAALTVITFLYRAVCGNHMLMGAVLDALQSRRHVGHHVAETADTMLREACRFLDRPESADRELILDLIGRSLGGDRETVIGKGRAAGLTEEQATAAYTAAEQFENDPRSVWGYTNGITRISQEAEFQSDRLTLDLLAAKMMQRAARVAA